MKRHGVAFGGIHIFTSFVYGEIPILDTRTSTRASHAMIDDVMVFGLICTCCSDAMTVDTHCHWRQRGSSDIHSPSDNTP